MNSNIIKQKIEELEQKTESYLSRIEQYQKDIFEAQERIDQANQTIEERFKLIEELEQQTKVTKGVVERLEELLEKHINKTIEASQRQLKNLNERRLKRRQSTNPY